MVAPARRERAETAGVGGSGSGVGPGAAASRAPIAKRASVRQLSLDQSSKLNAMSSLDSMLKVGPNEKVVRSAQQGVAAEEQVNPKGRVSGRPVGGIDPTRPPEPAGPSTPMTTPTPTPVAPMTRAPSSSRVSESAAMATTTTTTTTAAAAATAQANINEAMVQRTMLSLLTWLAPTNEPVTTTAAALADGTVLARIAEQLFGSGATVPRAPPLVATQAALQLLASAGVRTDDVVPAALVAGNDTRLALRVALRVWLRFVGVGAEGETRKAMLSWVATLLPDAPPPSLAVLARANQGQSLLRLVDALSRSAPTMAPAVPAAAALDKAAQLLRVPAIVSTTDLLETKPIGKRSSIRETTNLINTLRTHR